MKFFLSQVLFDERRRNNGAADRPQDPAPQDEATPAEMVKPKALPGLLTTVVGLFRSASIFNRRTRI